MIIIKITGQTREEAERALKRYYTELDLMFEQAGAAITALALVKNALIVVLIAAGLFFLGISLPFLVSVLAALATLNALSYAFEQKGILGRYKAELKRKIDENISPLFDLLPRSGG